MTCLGFLTSSSSASGSEPLAAGLSAFAGLPVTITPTLAGLAVGAFVGVVGFVVVLLVVGRTRRPRRPLAADNVVFIPPYTTLPRETPVPAAWMAPPPAPSSFPPPAGPRQGFRPSTELSARAFAKMGYAVDAPVEAPSYASYEAPARGDAPAARRDAPYEDPEISFEEAELEPEEELAVHQPVSVAPVVVVAPPPEPIGPHPLATIPTSSAAMRAATPPMGITHAPSAGQATAASIADLDLDDGATQISETIFDEPPQPRRRTDPPRIRAVAPTPPRFPTPTPLLPQVTPPPARVRQFHQG